MAIAKTKDAFKKVDFGYVTDFAWATHADGVPTFHLISSTGASASAPFLYPRTKGKAERWVRGLGFRHTQIYRPGLLGRDEPTSIEKCYGSIVSALPAHFFAQVIVSQAHLVTTKLQTDENRDQNATPITEIWSNSEIYKYAKKNNIQKAT